jgi:hypothetical protein
MNLALAIVFLWLGAALLWVAFGGLGKHSESLLGSPADVAKSINDAIAQQGNAYGT